jgi:hypothetical protein
VDEPEDRANVTLHFSPLARQVASTSLLAMFLAFVIYTVAYIALVTRFEIPKWTTVADFEQQRTGTWFKLLTICQGLAFVTPIFFVGFLASLHTAVPEAYQVLSLMALSSAVLFAAFSSIHYVVQFALARSAPSSNDQLILGHLYQLNPEAVITSVNLLGWTLFFGLSCVLIVPLFLGSTIGNIFASLLLVNAIACCLGLVGYLYRIRLLSFMYFNLMGLAVIAFSITGFMLLAGMPR